MKERFRLVQLGNRGGAFYCKDIITGSRTSLKTKNRAEAELLVLHKNEAIRHPLLNRKIGMAYLAGIDTAITKRTWQAVMEDIIKDKDGPTLRRWRVAMRDKAFILIRNRVVIETLPEELLMVLRTGNVSTNVYLRRLQNHCVGMGWFPLPILPRKLFPKIVHREKRAVTWVEHCQIILGVIESIGFDLDNRDYKSILMKVLGVLKESKQLPVLIHLDGHLDELLEKMLRSGSKPKRGIVAGRCGI